MQTQLSTPWGPAQTTHEEHPGLIWVSTASHGGFHLDRNRMAAFRRRFPFFSTYAGGPWFEEDQDWAAVVLAFSDEFTDEQVFDACRTARISAKPCNFNGRIERYQEWETLVDWLQHDQIGCNVQHRANAFEEKMASLYERGSMGTTDTPGTWWVFLRPMCGGECIECRMSLDQIYEKRFFTYEEVAAAAV